MACEAGRSLGFDPAVLLDGPVDSAIPLDIAADVQSTLREALSNVVRHAGATRVQVEISANDDVCLRVIDDGVGPPAADAPMGNGLRNMAARAEARGGSLTVEPGSTGGTVLTWRVPID
jgi:signal transduction histidine kinase